MRVEDLLEARAFDAIEKSVQEAERGTAGEIVPMIVARSEAYNGVRAASAAVLAFCAGAIQLAYWPQDAWIWLPPAQLITFILGYLVFGWRPLLRRLIPTHVRAACVDRAARLAFLEHGMFETRHRTGILLYVSLLEHRVEVLADRGVDARVEDGTWDGIVRTILDGIRTGEAEAGLLEAIRRSGEILASVSPPLDDDTNELPDRVLREED